MRRLSTLTVLSTTLAAAAALAVRRRESAVAPVTPEPPPALPEQRTPFLREVLTGDADLLLAEQDARDAHVLDVLDGLVRRG